MPTHPTVSDEASELADLVAKLEKQGEEIIQILPAGQGFTVVTKPKRTPRPKASAR